jgi:hypothetical protein
MAEVRWRQFECPACEAVQHTQSERKILARILFCDNPNHRFSSECAEKWECPAASVINEVAQWWAQCPFHGALEAHFLRVREMRGETVHIEAEKKLGGWVELHVWSVSKRSRRILYSLDFTIYKHDPKIYVRVNDRDKLFALPTRDFLRFAPRRWVQAVLDAFASQPAKTESQPTETESAVAQ